jgi:hypothetical protein
MKNQNLPVAKRSLLYWISSASIRLHVILVVVILATVLIQVLPLEL